MHLIALHIGVSFKVREVTDPKFAQSWPPALPILYLGHKAYADARLFCGCFEKDINLSGLQLQAIDPWSEQPLLSWQPPCAYGLRALSRW